MFWRMPILVTLVLTVIRIAACAADSDAPALNGRIILQGEHIKSFALNGDSGTSFADPPESVVVPCGTYPGATVVLDAGNGKTFTGKLSSLSVVPDTPLVLKVGGPLVQRVSVDASGGFVRLVYRLVDRGGNEYRPFSMSRANRPAFAMYKGGIKIASGSFEYG